MLDMHRKCRFDIRKLALFLHRRFLAIRATHPRTPAEYEEDLIKYTNGMATPNTERSSTEKKIRS